LSVSHRNRAITAQKATGLHFWARGYCVSTLGYDDEAVRRYVREQEAQDSGQDRLDLNLD
jgi:putative transposase